MDHVKGARALRLGVIKNLFGQGRLTREEALKCLNLPLSPNDPDSPVIDDRDKIDWTVEQFVQWMKGNSG